MEMSLSEEDAEPPMVQFFHACDPERWQTFAAALTLFAARCERGEFRESGRQELCRHVAEIHGLAPNESFSDALFALSGALGSDSPEDKAELLGKVPAFLARLALSLPALFPLGLPMLVQEKTVSVHLTRKQCAALLAAAFFGILPDTEVQTCARKRKMGPGGQRLDLPGFDLVYLLGCESEKAQCLICYFRQVASATDAFMDEVVSFSRRVAEPLASSFWQSLDKPLSTASVVDGCIEASSGNLQADFANEYLGGGALLGGNVQEEIRFIVCPECTVGMLFCECMLDHEAIFIVGSLQYSRYAGYGGSFRFDGLHHDEGGAADSLNRRGPHIVAFDALCFPSNQYSEEQILRELTKAYVACLGDIEESSGPRCEGFATGNWGCGVFGGDPQLKSLIQWLAVSAVDRRLVYFPFGDARVDDLPGVIQLIQDSGMRCRDLFEVLLGNSKRNVFARVVELVRARARRG